LRAQPAKLPPPHFIEKIIKHFFYGFPLDVLVSDVLKFCRLIISRLINFTGITFMRKHDPPESLDFLLANIAHLHHTRAHQLLDSVGLYRGQPPVLRALWQQEGLTQTELADRMKITPATMTKMLQRMEKTGFIQRKMDSEDQRVSRVYLTEMGRSVQKDLEALFGQMEAETFENFTLEDRDRLRRFFQQIRENLIVATGEEPWK
jgi:MarR family transcriptional regulator, organic hydroperoxide resistance regulator